MKKFPFIKQQDSMECGATCLRMICQFYGKVYSAAKAQDLCKATNRGVSMLSLSEAAEYWGFRTVCAKLSLDKLVSKHPLPCILHWNQEHFVVLYDIKRKRNGKLFFYIADPTKELIVLDEESFCESWISTSSQGEEKGIALFLFPTTDFYEKEDEKGKGKQIHKFLWEYVKPYKKYFFHILLGLLVGSILQMIFPFLTQLIVDKGIKERNIDFIYLVLLAQLMLTVSRASVDFVRRWILLHISVRINISLLSDFLIKLMRLPMRFFDAKQIGDLLQRIDDHGRVERFLTAQTLNILFSVFSFVVFAFILLYYNAVIFFIFLLGSLFYLLWSIFFLHKRRIIDYAMFEYRAKNQSKTLQLLSSIQEIKLQNCERRRRWEWEDIQASLFQYRIKSTKLQQTQEAGSIFINEVKNIIITIVAATSVINGDLSLGMMLSIQYIIGQLNYPIEQVAQSLYEWQDVQISLERMKEIREREDEDKNRKIAPDFSAEIKSDIEINHLTFQYDGVRSPKVLDDICLTIPEGKITAVVGASGSGKSTLIKMLLGYYEPVEGTIKIGDYDISLINLKSWRNQCGVVMQDGYIFSETIARNIAVDDCEINKESLLKASHIANIEEFVERLPLKYNTKIGQDGQGISQGQKQRILIARAVYKEPKFIFLDEATNSLDANNEQVIVNNLESFYKGKTVVIIAHRLSTVKSADQIVVLENGKIIEKGNHLDLVDKKGAYYQLVKNQLDLES